MNTAEVLRRDIAGASATIASMGGAASREEVERWVDDLVRECRETCLWYQRPDYRPRTDAERLVVLDAIQRHADRRSFQRAARLKEWLSQLSSGASASS